MRGESSLNEVSVIELQRELERRKAREFREASDKYIAELGERVRANVGGVVAVFREIVTHESRDESCVVHVIDSTQQLTGTYLEIGIINGRLVDLRNRRILETINLVSREYRHEVDVEIPVRRKVSSPGLSAVILGEDFLGRIEDEGRIGFGLREVGELRSVVWGGTLIEGVGTLPRSVPYLTDFRIGVGDDEVREHFVGKLFFPPMKMLRERVDLIELLKSDKLEERVDAYRNKSGEELRGNLQNAVNQLIGVGAEFDEHRREIMRLEWLGYGGDKGDTLDYGWSNEKVYRQYEELKKRFEKLSRRVSVTLESGRDVELMARGVIEGIPVGDYIAQNRKRISEYERIFSEIDVHLTKVSTR